MRIFLFYIIFINSLSLFSQVINDKCENANEILVSERNFGIGIFKSKAIDLKEATKEVGETCSEDIVRIGNCFKTVWYKFTIPTTRNVEVILKQKDSLIPQIFVGFTIYKSTHCDINPNNLSNQLTPLSKFGASGNSCLQSGTYYIQVSSKASAKDSIWIELNIKPSNVLTYDHKETPYEYKTTNSTISYNPQLECLSLEEVEIQGVRSNDYKKSFWLNCEFSLTSVKDQISIVSDVGFAYRTFSAMPNNDSFNLQKPFIYLFGRNINATILNNECDFIKSKKIFIQIIIKDSTSFIRPTVISSNATPDLWNTPITNFFLNTNNTTNTSQSRYLNCTGVLKKHGCKNIILDTIIDVYKYNNPNIKDVITSLDRAAYIVVNSSEAGILNINTLRGSHGIGSKYIIYEGDIRNQCDLTKLYESNIQNTYEFCVENKTYTIVVAYRNPEYNTPITVEITQKAYVNNVKHYQHSDVKNLGIYNPNITSVFANGLFSFHDKDTIVQIDTFKKVGKFIFSEFYLSNDASLDFGIMSNNITLGLYVFKGRFIDNTIKTIDFFNYKTQNYDRCKIFEEGYYTVLLFQDSLINTKVTPCLKARGQFNVKKVYVCPNGTVNNRPDKAIEINNNLDLLSNSAVLNGINYIYNFGSCIDCDAINNSVLPKLNCNSNLRYNNGYYRSIYYSFYISENAEIKAPFNSVLYKGNIKQNQSLINDTNKLIDPCSFDYIYCNLEGNQYYTLVIFTTSNRGTYTFSLEATKHKQTINDFAKNAFDLGHFNSTKNITSPKSVMTCHTSSAPTDPEYYEVGSFPLRRRNLSRENWPLNYKDVLNKKRNVERRNMWYTFTAEGNNTITVTLNSTNSTCKNDIYIYRYTNGFNLNFNGNFDSTSNGLELVKKNTSSSSGCLTNSVQFINESCRSERYFLLVENENTPNAEYSLNLKSNYSANQTSIGNNCNTAIQYQATQFGNIIINGNNHCNTWGESPYENPMVKNVRSTWFEVDVKNINKFDLEISYTGSTKISSYNVYAGECGYLTKVSELKSGLSYFTLSCMTIGKIFIQAVTEKPNIGNLQFTVKIKQPLSINCKPYDFKSVVAQFFLKGGCTNDSIYSDNISTQGSNIQHLWYVNNIYYSNQANPVLLTNSSGFKIGNNDIKLVVINTLFNTRDSAIVNFYKNNVPYFLEINYPKVVYCPDSINLEIQTNFTNNLNYVWKISNTNLLNPYQESQKIKGYNYYNITLSAISDNCFFYDTVEINVKPTLKIFKDAINSCNAMKYCIDIIEYTNVQLNGIPVNSNFCLDTSGKYIISGYYNNCLFIDTFNLLIYDSIVHRFYNDTHVICNNNPIEIKYNRKLQEYLWNNGSKDSSIFVNNAGNYFLIGNLNRCEIINYHVNIINEQHPTKFLRDTAICENDTFYFKTPPMSLTIDYQSPNLQKWIVKENTPIYVTLKNQNCTIHDSAIVEVILHPNLFADTVVCFSNILNSIDLDGYEANYYNWLGENSNSRYLTVNKYGNMILERLNTNFCIDTIHYQVKELCPLSVYLPNVFSPNGDPNNNTYKFVINGEYQSFNFTIFNRWGEIIYKSNSKNEWDGYYKGALVAEGVYGVLLEVVADKKYIYRTTVTLLF
jgi:gliding motility-associated-like protein